MDCPELAELVEFYLKEILSALFRIVFIQLILNVISFFVCFFLFLIPILRLTLCLFDSFTLVLLDEGSAQCLHSGII